MSFTSDEVNYLIYRYLEESGLRHSAFTLANESMLSKSAINGADVLPGALVTLLQKGLQYIDIEWHLTEDGVEVECDATPNLLSALKGKPADAGPPVPKAKDKEQRADTGKRKEAGKDKKDKRIKSEDAGSGAPASMAPAPPVESAEPEDDSDLNLIPEQDVTVLRGHSSEVFICSWNSQRPLLASAGGDCTAMVWPLSDASGPAKLVGEPTVMTHTANLGNKDVTSLDWSPNGNLLATGAYDGIARIWSSKGSLMRIDRFSSPATRSGGYASVHLTGELVRTLSRHRGPIFSLKWNSAMDSLLSGSVDKTAVVWDANSGDVRQQFEFHTAPIMDVDWRDNVSFASCSGDQTVAVCKVGETKPLKVFRGHKSEVNAIRWDPTGTLLASCSDDATAKIWSLKSDTALFDFQDHTKEIYTLKWNPATPAMLATASFDTTVRLWDANVGRCMHTLKRHRGPVYSVAFSPDGKYLASGAFDNVVLIWSVKDGALLRAYRGKAGIYEVSWNANGNKIAACFADSSVRVHPSNV